MSTDQRDELEVDALLRNFQDACESAATCGEESGRAKHRAILRNELRGLLLGHRSVSREGSTDVLRALGEVDAVVGCVDHSCLFKKPQGVGTNGGCRCARKPGVMQRLAALYKTLIATSAHSAPVSASAGVVTDRGANSQPAPSSSQTSSSVAPPVEAPDDTTRMNWLSSNVSAITTRDEFGIEREWPKEYFSSDDTFRAFLDEFIPAYDDIVAASLAEGETNG